jgi:hypothetical protein
MSVCKYPQALALIIADNPTHHLWAKRHLTEAGFRLVSALNELDGIDAFKSVRRILS